MSSLVKGIYSVVSFTVKSLAYPISLVFTYLSYLSYRPTVKNSYEIMASIVGSDIQFEIGFLSIDGKISSLTEICYQHRLSSKNPDRPRLCFIILDKVACVDTDNCLGYFLLSNLLIVV